MTPMTVGQLIEALQTMPVNDQVVTDQDYTYQPVTSVEIHVPARVVIIR